MIVGLVGKPNSGKSSMLKALTLADVKISPVPFTTIKPNVAVAHVIADCVCKEFGVKCNPRTGMCKNGKRFIPVQVIDVAGLILGSHEGRGLGFNFLDDLRQADALIQVVDASGTSDSEGKPTIGYDPGTEIEFLEREIDLWFADVIERALDKFRQKLMTSPRADIVSTLSEQLSGLSIGKHHVEQVIDKVPVTDTERFARILRKLSKPILIAANKIDLEEAEGNIKRMKEKFKELIIIPASAEAEIALKKATEKGMIDYLPGNDFTILSDKIEEKQVSALDFIKRAVIDKFGSTGVQNCLNSAVFELLKYIVVYPVADANKLTDKDGKRILPDAFLVPKGTTMKGLAFKVHTQLGEKFICGIDARSKRKLSADYELKNNDVVEIAFAR